MRRYQKALPAIIGILALLAGAWSFAPRASALAQAQTTATATPASRPLSFPSGFSANQKDLLQSQYDFSVDISSITPGSLSASDQTALDVMAAQNYIALQMARVAMSKGQNAQVRAHARLLYQMRLKDQQLLNQIEAQVRGTGETPTAAVSETPAATASATTVATEVATTSPTASATAVATTAATVAPTVAATTAATESVTPAATTAATASATTAATEAPTGEATGTSSGSSVNGEGGVSPLPSLNAVPILPDTTLGRLGFHTINLNRAFLANVTRFSGSHVDSAFIVQTTSLQSMAMDTDRVVETTASNPVLQSIARHLEEEYGLSNLILQVLGDRVFFGVGLGVAYPPPVSVSGKSGAQSNPPSTPSGNYDIR